MENSGIDISSIIDTWIMLCDFEINGERNRGLYILKSRGMNNSNQIRELVMSDNGVDLAEVYIGQGGVLTGSARLQQENNDKKEIDVLMEELDETSKELKRKKIENKAKQDLLATQNQTELLLVEQKISNLKRQLELIEKSNLRIAHKRKT